MPESQIKATYIHHCGTDLTTVNAARVSFGKKSSLEEDAHGVWRMNDKDVKLINYLAKHEHLSPFGHCFFTFHVKAPVFVRAQLVKHEYLRMNEISRRYVSDSPELYTPDTFRNAPVGSVKQGSSGEHYDSADWIDIYVDCSKGWLNLYQQMVKDGVAPEQARMVLPQSMMTEWYWSGSLDAFFNMCRLRLKPEAQYESKVIALQVSNAIENHCPVSWAALMENLSNG